MAFIDTIISTLANFGWLNLVLILIADIILWKIHPVIGFLAVLFSFALIVGLL